jgi:small-conductance mechanosensitive channel
MKRASCLTAVVLAVAVGWAAPAFGQAPTNQTAEPPLADVEGLGVIRAPVVIDGEVLFSLRGVSAYPAERRAADIAERIRELARDPAVVESSLTVEDRPLSTWVLSNGQLFLAVFDEDAALETLDRRVLAEAFRLRIWSAIAAYREARQPAVLWTNALLSLGATLMLLVGAYAVRRAVGWLQARVERRYRTQVHDVTIQSFEIVKAEQLWRALSGFLNLVWAVTVVGMIFVYLRYVLGSFPWTRGTASSLASIVVDPLRSMGLGLLGVIPNLVFLAILFLVVRYLLKLVRLFFDSVAIGRVQLASFDAEWALPTYKIARLFVIAFALVVAYPYVPGSNTDAFKGVTLFIGVLFSLGSSSMMGNIISGYGMTYRRTFRIGDIVRIGSHVGEVQELRLLVTRLRTPKNEEVIVPNSAILTSEVVNYSSMAKDRGLILHTNVGIGYETPWRQVEAMLIEAAARTPGLLRDRPPFVHHTSLGDFSVNYEINVYCETPHRMRQLYTELHRNILDVFNEYGVQIMTPAYEGDPDQPKVVPREQWYAEPALPPAAGALEAGGREPSPTRGGGFQVRGESSDRSRAR